jgi:hypothetical protein
MICGAHQRLVAGFGVEAVHAAELRGRQTAVRADHDRRFDDGIAGRKPPQRRPILLFDGV